MRMYWQNLGLRLVVVLGLIYTIRLSRTFVQPCHSTAGDILKTTILDK